MKRLVKVRAGYNGAIDIYKYDQDYDFNFGDKYVVETRYGHDIGVILPNSISLENIQELDPEFSILRKAEEEDFVKKEECVKKGDDAFLMTKEKIIKHELPMKLISVHFFLDGNKILFTFTADGRVDFRELVKDLAATFKTRIELRQIGVRDESTILGGFGVCGREFCCTKHHAHGEPISIKMAKDQNLTLNSVKISGVCGRLMCCLDYELDQYIDELGVARTLYSISELENQIEYAPFQLSEVTEHELLMLEQKSKSPNNKR